MKMQILFDGILRTLVLETGEQEGSFLGTLDGAPVAFAATLAIPGVASLIVQGARLSLRA